MNAITDMHVLYIHTYIDAVTEVASLNFPMP